MTEIPHMPKWKRIILAIIDAEKDRRATTKTKLRRPVRNQAEVQTSTVQNQEPDQANS